MWWCKRNYNIHSRCDITRLIHALNLNQCKQRIVWKWILLLLLPMIVVSSQDEALSIHFMDWVQRVFRFTKSWALMKTLDINAYYFIWSSEDHMAFIIFEYIFWLFSDPYQVEFSIAANSWASKPEMISCTARWTEVRLDKTCVPSLHKNKFNDCILENLWPSTKQCLNITTDVILPIIWTLVVENVSQSIDVTSI